MDATPTFGQLLKRHRRAAQRTQEELAECAGYSAHYVSMLERGVRLPPPFTVDALADALALPATARAALHAAAGPHPHPASPGVSPPALPLIGREPEVARVVRLLRGDGVRLLTLTGPGGVGKTALARQAAAVLARAAARCGLHPGEEASAATDLGRGRRAPFDGRADARDLPRAA
jgi:transcriptional regulator with XRE-family HTH domain